MKTHASSLLALILLAGATAVPAQAPATANPTPGAVGAPNAGAGRAGGGGRGGQADPNAGVDFSPKPPVLPLTPAQEQQRFRLQPGYKIEPVLTDPVIEEPAALAFDGNGR